MMAPAVETRALSLRYPSGHQALMDVDLTVEPGELASLVGSNGAGKSTLLRCLVRLKEPTGGTVRIGGTQVTGASGRSLRRIRREVGFVFQRFNLVDRISAFANVTHGAVSRHGTRCVFGALVPAEVRREAMECLDRVGLAQLAGRRVDRLSGGQQQRVAIARALMQRPSLVLADEPVASLDPAAGRAVMELLRDIATERGITVIAALHQVDLALTYTRRIIGLRAGELVLDRPASLTSPGMLAELYGASASADLEGVR